MAVNCIHWQPGSKHPPGLCVIGAKKNPSPGACASCTKREPKDASAPAFTADALAPATAGGADPLAIVGPKRWAELHLWALALAERIDASAAAKWLDGFRLRVPCGDCRGEFDLLVRATPPDFSSPTNLFRSTWEWHNGVNAKLGKPSMAEAIARAHWLEILARRIASAQRS